jgi:hypothetical protein
VRLLELNFQQLISSAAHLLILRLFDQFQFLGVEFFRVIIVSVHRLKPDSLRSLDLFHFQLRRSKLGSRVRIIS